MAFVPPVVEEVLAGRSPIVGVPTEAEAAAHTLMRIQEEINTSYFQASQAVTCLLYLRSVSVTKIIDGLNDRFLPGAAALSDDLSAASHAFGVYADETARVHTLARDIVSDVEQHLARIRACSYELESAASALRLNVNDHIPSCWNQKPIIMPPLASEALGDFASAEIAARAWAVVTWTAQAMSWALATDRIHECQARWSRLIDERCEAEQRLVSKLSQTSLGSSLKFGGTPDRAGITRTYTAGPVHPSRTMTHPLLQEIMSGRLTPQQVNENWATLGLSEAAVSQLPIQAHFVLSKADGVPFRVQNIASRKALDYAITHTQEAHALLGLSKTEVSYTSFIEQTHHLRAALLDAENSADDLFNLTVQLVGFGTHEGALTAAISLGDIDRASNVAVNVPGMGSDVSGIGDGVQGAHTLFQGAQKESPTATPAIVTWIGYRSPADLPGLEVLHGRRASSGAVPLANFIDGINIVRDSGEQPVREFVVLAHSYGSTTAAEALKITNTRNVDAFITYGSAGLESDTTLDQLNADTVYSTMARGDQVAGVGVLVSARIDPTDIDGVLKFSSEGSNRSKGVTMHGMYAHEGEWSPVNWQKRGYLSEDTESAEVLSLIIAGGAP